MFETIVIAAARDRVDDAVRGSLARDPICSAGLGDHCLPSEPRFAPMRHRLSQTLRRLSERLEPPTRVQPASADGR